MKNVFIGIAAILGAFVLWSVFRTVTPEEREMDLLRGGIKQCWSEQSRKSLGAGEARFIAGACEKMEADFRTRYKQSP